jgi:hypothetical protein
MNQYKKLLKDKKALPRQSWKFAPDATALLHQYYAGSAELTAQINQNI